MCAPRWAGDAGYLAQGGAEGQAPASGKMDGWLRWWLAVGGWAGPVGVGSLWRCGSVSCFSFRGGSSLPILGGESVGIEPPAAAAAEADSLSLSLFPFCFSPFFFFFLALTRQRGTTPLLTLGGEPMEVGRNSSGLWFSFFLLIGWLFASCFLEKKKKEFPGGETKK